FAFDCNLGFYQTFHRERRPEQFPGHSSERASKNSAECFRLLVRSAWVHDKHALTVALMNRFWPGDNRRALHAAEWNVSAGPALNIHADESAATAILRTGKSGKITATSKVAIAKLIAAPFHHP